MSKNNYIRNSIIVLLSGLFLLSISCDKSDQDLDMDANDSTLLDSSMIDSNDTVIIKQKYDVVKIYGEWGNIYLWLFDETPIHKERFLWLVNNGYFQHQTFNRIINNFVVQGGTDMDTVTNLDTVLEMSSYEKIEGLVHQLGALGAARLGDDVNPDRKDMGDQWYICEEIRAADAARLDTGYVIFGQVISDLEIITNLGKAPKKIGTDVPDPTIYFQIDTLSISESFIRDSLGFNLDSLMIN
jgi:cyclophilin family peptidyl-prolyl cis-trans isomerase